MSKYGGQAAAAGVEGYKSGYSFQDKARVTHQKARLREEQIEEAKTKNNLMDVAYQDAMGYGAEPTQEQKLTTQVQELEARVSKTNGGIMNNDINELAMQNNPKDREQYVRSLQTKFKTNPEVYKALGIQNPQTMGILNPADSRDREWMENTLMAKGQNVKREDYGDNWDDMITETMAAYPAIKADGAIVDLNGLSVATGAASMATPQYNKVMEKNRNELQARWDRDMQNTENAMTADLGGKGAGGDGYVDRPDKPLEDPTEAVFEARNKAFNEGTADIEKTQEAERSSVKDMIANIETGNSKDPYKQGKNKNGYETKYQFRFEKATDAGTDIAKRMGVTPDQIRNSPELQEKMMDIYMEDNAKALEKKGHEASAYNIWLAHNQGAGGANAILTGKLTDTIRRNIRNQGVKGDTDEELINNYHNKFKSKMADTPNGKKVITDTINKEVSSNKGQPLNDMRMRKIYALLGRNYPKDPNEATAKMKNYDFLSERVGEKQAMEAVFGSTGSPGRMEKAIKFLRTLEPGTKEYKAQENYIKKLGRSGTASKFDRDEAITANKKLDAKGTENWTKEDKTDYASNNEVIQGYDKTAKEQNREADRADRVRADDMLIESATEVEESRRTGKPLSATTREKLKSAEQIKRAAQTDLAKADDKKLEEMNGKRRAANSTASFINRITDGDLAKDYDKDIVANPISWVQNLFGSENEKTQSALQKKATAAIKANTRLGIIQANYIKSMSGTAASDAERQFLTEIMMGNSWGDETALMTAITEFYDSQVEDIQDYNIAVSPAQEHRAKQVDRIRRDSRTEKEGTHAIGGEYKGQKIINKSKDGKTLKLADGSEVKV